MLEPEQRDEQHLRSQLETYELIVEANKELMDKNISTSGDLAAKLATAERFLDQLELPGDNVAQFTALNKANQLISEIDNVIKKILSQDAP